MGKISQAAFAANIQIKPKKDRDENHPLHYYYTS